MNVHKTETSHPAGIYVHVPFCLRKCLYCNFFSTTDLSYREPYLRALRHEASIAPGRDRPADTLYIGGGTPSLLGVDDIRRIVETVKNSFHMLPRSEITVEINPGTADPRRLAGYRLAGVNRVNIGVQSFHDNILKFLGRIHSGRDAAAILTQTRQAGVDNIGIDLIYGIPGQTMDLWIEDLSRALDFAPEHLSCYMLTYEAGTPLEKEVRKGRLHPLEEQLVADMFDSTRVFLNAQGYDQYEISNFARHDDTSPRDYRSRHNLKYWTFSPYIGLGPSAHSFLEPVRSWNHDSVTRYIRESTSGRLPVQEKETLGNEELVIEAIYLGLRQAGGIEIDWFNKKFGEVFHTRFKNTLSFLEEKGLIAASLSACRLTGKGMRYLDAIAAMFVSREMEGEE
jgi:putative oxygen-independent coproporphyrinogen III oxidase